MWVRIPPWVRMLKFWYNAGHALLICTIGFAALSWGCVFYGIWSDDVLLKDNLAESVMFFGASGLVTTAVGLGLLCVPYKKDHD